MHQPITSLYGPGVVKISKNIFTAEEAVANQIARIPSRKRNNNCFGERKQRWQVTCLIMHERLFYQLKLCVKGAVHLSTHMERTCGNWIYLRVLILLACIHFRDGSKFMRYPGRDYRQGGADFFWEKKRGAKTFFGRKKRGRRPFLKEKKGTRTFFEEKKGGRRVF